MHRFGNLLFSKTSWGRTQLFTTFGYTDSSKTTLSSIDAGVELLLHMQEKQGWVYLKDAINELLEIPDTMETTDSKNVVFGKLMVIWNKYHALTHDTCPNECHTLQYIMTSIKNDFMNQYTIGRVQLKERILQHTLNIFHTI